jgi:hypothetical protein
VEPASADRGDVGEGGVPQKFQIPSLLVVAL